MTVNRKCYFQVLEYMRRWVRRARPELFPDKLMMYQDNAPSHTSISVRELLAKKLITFLENQAYSPDLTLCDFFLFLTMKNCLRGTYFETVEDIQKVTMSVLSNLQEICFWKRFDRNNADIYV
jgi:hypothetical protein